MPRLPNDSPDPTPLRRIVGHHREPVGEFQLDGPLLDVLECGHTIIATDESGFARRRCYKCRLGRARDV